MRYIFNFPDIGEGLEEGTILQWYVSKGQAVSTGDALVQMETDKVVVDIPSPRTGTVVAMFGEAGDIIKVRSPLVEIEVEGVPEGVLEAVKGRSGLEPKESAGHVSEEKAETVVGTMEVAAKDAVLPASREGRPEQEEQGKASSKALATPAVRAMAKDLDIDIDAVAGTGPSGRVTRADLLNYQPAKRTGEREPAAAGPATGKFMSGELAAGGIATVGAAAGGFEPGDGDVTYEPLTQIRKTIAKT